MGRVTEQIVVTVPGVPTGVDDAQGNPILGAPTVSTVTVKAFAPRESSESAELFGARVITGGTVYGFPGLAVPSDAILTIRGLEYVIDGDVGDHRPAYTTAALLGAEGVEFSVKRAH